MSSRSRVRQSSPAETAASIGVLAVLVGTAIWLWFVQARFSPAVTIAVSAAQAAERAKAPASPPPAARALAPAVLLQPLPASVRPMSPMEAFTPDTLSDKIDGKAELYLSAGFAGMRSQRLAAVVRPSAWFEAFVYDMATPENAFAVYSSQKRTATEEAGVGDYGYRAGNQLCVVHGRYYLEFVGADDSKVTLGAATELARAFIAATTIGRHANVAKDEALFPGEGLVPGSVMLLSADVFGFDQLTQTYLARYQEGEETVVLFLSRRANPAEAAKLAAAVRGFFVEDCGGRETPAPAAPAGAVLVDADGSFDGVFSAGSLLGGVRQAPSRPSAERWLQLLNARFQTAAP